MPLYPPGSGTTLSDATPANVQPGVPDAGVATEASRDDHAHDASWSGVAPSASAPGDAAATGAAQGFNRRDHVHGRESYATIASNLKLDDLAAPDDNTDLNVLTTKHGLAPKLSNVSTEYLSGTGVYSVPAGGGGIPATIVDAKGDLIAATAADTVARLAVGTDTHVLTADAAEATGLKWAVAPGAAGGIPATIFDAAGDIIQASAADTAARLAAGTAGQFLKSGGAATVNAWASRELDYAEITSNVSQTATSEATANTIVTGASVAYDGSTAVVIEFFAAQVNPNATNALSFVLYEDGASIGILGVLLAASVGIYSPVNLQRRLTPSAASHTYSIRVFGGASGGTVYAASGGSGNNVPAFMRITRAL